MGARPAKAAVTNGTVAVTTTIRFKFFSLLFLFTTFHLAVVFSLGFYPLDAMLARVIVIATCLSVRPSLAGIVSKS